MVKVLKLPLTRNYNPGIPPVGSVTITGDAIEMLTEGLYEGAISILPAFRVKDGQPQLIELSIVPNRLVSPNSPKQIFEQHNE